ncbi:SBBP repeat-containing protein [Oscillatoria sp. CS-180]|uniref:SBBP repeat-containing protein n=1 Tax=Oscillatoria sp. CS-180 TaxID=3021720 RepID=UPI00232F120D|nr:SBBP repeat-containing protein [Oscillatoria sp. CS-180]MDB9526162.1 SBBP repeat-containing protein [Oscillatoria sp. CS-180]
MNPQSPFANEVLTPGSEPIFGGNELLSLVFGRQGNDTLISYDFDEQNNYDFDIDVLFGDLEIVPSLIIDSLFQTLAGNPPSGGSDRFVLGDWQQPYYVATTPTNTFTLGFNDFAVLYDFNPAEDTIQLHGNPDDYFLVDIGVGEIIFWQTDFGIPDAIGFIISSPELVLTLEDDVFLFAGNTPPPVSELTQIKQLGSAGIDLGITITVDSEGSFYVGGATNGSLLDENLGAYDGWLTKFNSAGEEQWSKQLGTDTFEAVFNTITDSDGNLYVTGTTRGDFVEPKQAGGSDLWIHKYDSDGNLLWSQQTGFDLQFDSFDIDIDADSNIYISGNRVKNNPNPEELGGVPVIDDPWVRKYDSDGNLLWFSEFGVPETFDESYGVAVGDDGRVYATGWTLGDLEAESSGFYDIWVTHLDNQTGEQIWIDQFGSEDFEFSWDIEVDQTGNIYSTGWTLGQLGDQSFGSYDVWLSKHLPDGTQAWVKQFGTSGDDGSFLAGMDIDANGNIFISGYTDGDLGGENAGSYDFWVAKYNADGEQTWIRQWGTPYLDYATDLVVDDLGHLFVTGFTEGSLGALSQGAYDAWIAKVDSTSGQLLEFADAADSGGDGSIPDGEVDVPTDNPDDGTNNGGGNSPTDGIDLEGDGNDTDAEGEGPGTIVSNDGFPPAVSDGQNVRFLLQNHDAPAIHDMGFFRVEDADGRVAGLLPGEDGYSEAALAQAKTLFSILPAASVLPGGDEISRTLALDTDDRYRFYLIHQYSSDEVKGGRASFDIAQFSTIKSVSFSSETPQNHVLTWETSDTQLESVFPSVELQVAETDRAIAIGADLQADQEGELLDLRAFVGQTLNAEFTLSREARYDNLIGFYRVDENGGVDTDGDGFSDILPGEDGYIAAALQQRLGFELTVDNRSTASTEQALAGGYLYAPFIVVDGSTQALLDDNTLNDPKIYFPFMAANSDQTDHVRLLSDNVFGFEDMAGGGDYDFNDMILEVDLAIA